ncbi:hypothetical protein PoB_002691500 [Plakobranchus ocellatus]|uniref:Uncharacterized protein n=1 Tax=Plakobranchus ocellatus TaxID=259542 RepID=A0AAV3ZYY8_9GAST|nr:hypothetical protein PoB_002691500 [Plakobranchus ocellatus]
MKASLDDGVFVCLVFNEETGKGKRQTCADGGVFGDGGREGKEKEQRGLRKGEREESERREGKRKRGKIGTANMGEERSERQGWRGRGRGRKESRKERVEK